MSPVVECEGQALQVGVQSHADAVSEPATRAGQEDLRQRIAQAADGGHHDVRARQQRDRPVLRRGDPREPHGGSLALQEVDQIPNWVRLEHSGHRFQNEHRERDGEGPTLAGAEPEQKRQRAAVVGTHCHERRREPQIGTRHGSVFPQFKAPRPSCSIAPV